METEAGIPAIAVMMLVLSVAMEVWETTPP